MSSPAGLATSLPCGKLDSYSNACQDWYTFRPILKITLKVIATKTQPSSWVFLKISPLTSHLSLLNHRITQPAHARNLYRHFITGL
jgi:hypothetical protein